MPINPSMGMQRNAITAAIMNRGFGTDYATPFGGPQITPGMSGVTPQTYDPALGASSLGAGLPNAGVPAPPSAPAPLPSSAPGGDWRGAGGTIGAMPSAAAPAPAPPAGQLDQGTGSGGGLNLPSSITSGMDFAAAPPPPPAALPQQPTGWTPPVFSGGGGGMPAPSTGNWGGNAGVIGQTSVATPNQAGGVVGGMNAQGVGQRSM